eukprot:GHRQ01021705.1.p1 GENE.GHRQ01021705.1~~GHRQ01021705.1.p1  ORF type:complete len:260 (+),score=27.31 GHRQ01021705.1:182-961(+)
MQVPTSWSNIRKVYADGLVYTVDLQENRLSGAFPRKWATLKGAITTLALDGNPGLTGCAPLDASTSVTFAGTGMSGVCKADTKDVEARQVQAVQARLVPLLGAGATASYNGMLTTLVEDIGGLGVLIKAGQTNSQFYAQLNSDDGSSFDIAIGVKLFEGATYITEFEVYGGAGLNLTHLVPLVSDLPRLEKFVCSGCSGNANPGPQDLLLPSQLAQVSPLMKWLELSGCGLQGPLPKSWGSWASLEALSLGTNDAALTL